MTEEEKKAMQDAIDEAVAKAEKESEKKNQQLLIDILEEQKKLVALAKANPVSADLKDTLLATNKDYQSSAFFSAQRVLKDNASSDSEIQKARETLKKIEEIEAKAVTAVAQEQTSADGGILVPALTDGSIRELVPTHNQALNLFTNIPMPKGNALTLPYVGTRPSGSWIGETEPIVQSKGSILPITLTPKKWGVSVPFSNELFEDATPEWGAFINGQLAIAEGTALDAACFGVGTSPFNGLFYSSNSFGKVETTLTTDPAKIGYKHLVAMVLGVDQAYRAGATWNLSAGALSLVMNILDENKKPIFDFNTMTLLNRPIKEITQAPDESVGASKTYIVFGNLKNSFLGDVGRRRVDLITSGMITVNSADFNLNENDATAIRLIKRYAFSPGMVAAYAVAKTSATD